jgi:hypothetical protein
MKNAVFWDVVTRGTGRKISEDGIPQMGRYLDKQNKNI